jgi:hypothetical protein
MYIHKDDVKVDWKVYAIVNASVLGFFIALSIIVFMFVGCAK